MGVRLGNYLKFGIEFGIDFHSFEEFFRNFSFFRNCGIFEIFYFFGIVEFFEIFRNCGIFRKFSYFRNCGLHFHSRRNFGTFLFSAWIFRFVYIVHCTIIPRVANPSLKSPFITNVILNELDFNQSTAHVLRWTYFRPRCVHGAKYCAGNHLIEFKTRRIRALNPFRFWGTWLQEEKQSSARSTNLLPRSLQCSIASF